MSLDELLSATKAGRAAYDTAVKRLEKANSGLDWDPVAAVGAVEGIAKAPELGDTVRRLAGDLLKELERSAGLRVLELASTVRNICESKGWKLDGEWPTFFVERGIEIRIDEQERAVHVAGRRAANLSAAGLTAEIEAAVSGLLPVRFDPAGFMRELAAAYDAAAAALGSREVAIWDLYREFVIRSQKATFWRDAKVRAFQEITADQFRARLSKSLEADRAVAPDGRKIRFLPPLDPKLGIFLYQPAERRFGYVGRVGFEQ